MFGQMILAALLVGVALPALGADTAPGTSIEITQVSVQAEADMQTILNRFTYEAIQATTPEELTAAHDMADNDITTIRNTAVADVDALLSLFPDELVDDASAARSRIDTSARSAHAEIDDITGQIAPALHPPPTTTTTSTTVPTATTTTLPASTTTTTTVPPTTTTIAAAVPPTGPKSSDPTLDIDEVVLALTPPPQLEPSTNESMSTLEGLRPETSLVTGAFVTTMSVVLPPSVATAVLSVPIVIEILIGTVFTSVQALVVPVLVLLVVGSAIVWRDAGFPIRRRSISQPPM